MATRSRGSSVLMNSIRCVFALCKARSSTQKGDCFIFTFGSRTIEGVEIVEEDNRHASRFACAVLRQIGECVWGQQLGELRDCGRFAGFYAEDADLARFSLIQDDEIVFGQVLDKAVLVASNNAKLNEAR